MTDLHTRLVAAIDQAERDAREDYQRGRGGHWAMFALHGLAEDRDILRRHRPSAKPVPTPLGPHIVCVYCSDFRADPVRVVGWPCWDAISLARRHGIDPEAATT